MSSFRSCAAPDTPHGIATRRPRRVWAAGRERHSGPSRFPRALFWVLTLLAGSGSGLGCDPAVPSTSSPSAPRPDASAPEAAGGTGGIRGGQGVPDASVANGDARVWSLDGGRDVATNDGERSAADAADRGTGGQPGSTGGATENATGSGGSWILNSMGGSRPGGGAPGGRGSQPGGVDGGSAPSAGGSSAGHGGGGGSAGTTGGSGPGGDGGARAAPGGGAGTGRSGAGGTVGGAAGAGEPAGGLAGAGAGAAGAVIPRVPHQGELRIDEVMVDPLGSDLGKEWIEIVNTSADVLDLSHLVVADDVNERPLTALPDRTEAWTLGPGLVRVLGQSADRAKNGDAPVDLVYGTQLGLNNAADRVALCWVSCAEVMLDEIRWDDSVASPSGRALVIGASDHRCPASTPYGPAVSGSFNAGTPGGPNDACP